MADIVIRGLDMPRPIAGEAGYVDFRIFSNGTAVMASAKPPYYKQFEAVALPEGHGRLGDLDELETTVIDAIEQGFNAADVLLDIRFAPTIVPAEGGKE